MAPFELILPEVFTTSAVFASPHSGRHYPDELMARTVLDAHTIRSSEDAFVDLLIQDAPKCGAPLLLATAPRAYIDLNRDVDELDPAVIVGVRSPRGNPRVSSGLGVIPRVVANGRSIYRGKIPFHEARQRLDSLWYPYHRALEDVLQQQTSRFGTALLLDCHSMPHEALGESRNSALRSIDVVLGDRFGASADVAKVDLIENAFLSEGLRVARNTPFAGAFITRQYGRPVKGQHAVQIEINRSIYMDEQRIEPLPDFDAFRAVMTRVMAKIAQIGRPETALAAE